MEQETERELRIGAKKKKKHCMKTKILKSEVNGRRRRRKKRKKERREGSENGKVKARMRARQWKKKKQVRGTK